MKAPLQKIDQASKPKKNVSNCPQVRLGKSNGKQEGVLLGPDPRYGV